MKEAFVDSKFQKKSLAIIYLADEIIQEYLSQGFVLTLRQLYYQFVARGYIPNNQRSYKNLANTISKARWAGYIDWEGIEDRTRGLERNLHLDGPRSAIELVREQYGIDMWENQDTAVEVWIEKEALAGVIQKVCSELDVPFFSCRGYVSSSEMWRAYKRFDVNGKRTVVIHLGDHDPSGIDMTRDNQDRFDKFFGWPDCVEIRRIALNMNQIEEYDPPPNPTKLTDSRAQDYIRRYGYESWELDALDPKTLIGMIRDTVDEYRDPDLWETKENQLAEEKAVLDGIIEKL